MKTKMTTPAALTLAVICGVAFVATVAVVQIRARLHVLTEEATRSDIRACLVALRIYRDDCGSFPDQTRGLQALQTDSGARGWKGPYLRGGVPTDRWGNPLRYTIEDGIPQLRSPGADGRLGTKDDITH
jgi:type II secretion system protein G